MADTASTNSTTSAPAPASQATAVPATATGTTAPATTSASTPAKSGSNGGFKATLTVFDMVIYGLIFMVPIAPFPIFASVYNASDGMPFLAYAIGGIAMLFTALSFGVMVPIFPSSGSIFTYTSEGINKGVGFVTGWLMILQYIITPDIMFIMAANSLKAIPGLADVPDWIWCLLFLAFCTLVAIRGIGTTMILDRIALVGELVVLGLVIGFAVVYIIQGHGGAHFSTNAIFDPSKFSAQAMFSAISLCALNFVGFGSVATLTQESKAGPKGPGRAMVIIVIILAALFCTLSFVVSCADPTGTMYKDHPTEGFYVVAGIVGGINGGSGEWLALTCEIANVLALGIFTGLAAQTSIARILYVMGTAGAMPKKLGEMNKKNATPVVATIFVGIVNLVVLFPMLAVGQNISAEMSNFGALASYFLLNFVVLWYCWGKRKEHKFFRHLLFPVLGCIFTGIFIFTLADIPKIVGVVWLVIGIVIYLVVTRKFHHVIDMAKAG